MSCGHSFHKKCIFRWFRKNHETCPICRAVAIIPLLDSISSNSLAMVTKSLMERNSLLTLFNGCMITIEMNNFELFIPIYEKMTPNYRKFDILLAITKKYGISLEFDVIFNEENITFQDEDGNSLFHWASRNHIFFGLSLLFMNRKNSIINCLNKKGETPLDVQGIDCPLCRGVNGFFFVQKLRNHGALSAAELTIPNVDLNF